MFTFLFPFEWVNAMSGKNGGCWDRRSPAALVKIGDARRKERTAHLLAYAYRPLSEAFVSLFLRGRDELGTNMLISCLVRVLPP